MVKSKHNLEVVAETILDFKMAAIYNEYNEHQSYRIPLISMPFGQYAAHTKEASTASCCSLVSFSISNCSRAPIVSLPGVVKIFIHVALPS